MSATQSVDASSQREELATVQLLTSILPSILRRSRTDHEENVALLESLNIRHLKPLPDTIQHLSGGDDLPPLIHSLTSLSSLIGLFAKPALFLSTTLLSISEFHLLHSHLKDAILSPRSHEKLSSPHQHNMPTILSSAEQLLLWLFHISGERVKSLSLHFHHVNSSTVLRYSDHVSWCVNTVFGDLIAWPTAEQRECLYDMMSMCDKAVAVLDGTHCPIEKPEGLNSLYYSGYKCKHTQNYLCCVDVLGVIVYVEGPFPGHMNDRTLYLQSELHTNPSKFLSEGEMILADGGFIGGDSLLVPIHSAVMEKMQEEKVQNVMEELNDEFTSNRIIVEDVFGWLKGRAHVLQEVYGRARDRQAEVFYAACRLHNFVRITRIEYGLRTK